MHPSPVCVRPCWLRGGPLLLLVLAVVSAAAVTVSARAQNNDSFAGRLPLSGSTATAVSNNLRAFCGPGEPNHAGVAGARSLWLTWTAPTTGTVNFSISGGGPSRTA